ADPAVVGHAADFPAAFANHHPLGAVAIGRAPEVVHVAVVARGVAVGEEHDGPAAAVRIGIAIVPAAGIRVPVVALAPAAAFPVPAVVALRIGDLGHLAHRFDAAVQLLGQRRVLAALQDLAVALEVRLRAHLPAARAHDDALRLVVDAGALQARGVAAESLLAAREVGLLVDRDLGRLRGAREGEAGDE